MSLGSPHTSSNKVRRTITRADSKGSPRQRTPKQQKQDSTGRPSTSPSSGSFGFTSSSDSSIRLTPTSSEEGFMAPGRATQSASPSCGVTPSSDIDLSRSVRFQPKTSAEEFEALRQPGTPGSLSSSCPGTAFMFPFSNSVCSEDAMSSLQTAKLTAPIDESEATGRSSAPSFPFPHQQKASASPPPRDDKSSDAVSSQSDKSTPATSISKLPESEVDSRDTHHDTSSEQLGKADTRPKAADKTQRLRALKRLGSAFWETFSDLLLLLAFGCCILVLVFTVPAPLNWASPVPWTRIYIRLDNIWDEVIDVWYHLIGLQWWLLGYLYTVYLLSVLFYLFLWPKAVSGMTVYAIKNRKMKEKHAPFCTTTSKDTNRFFTITLPAPIGSLLPSMLGSWAVQ
ncbi:hypothetical protein FBEOM_6534 [Fusarium beomiforme]|uniref:Transmembrane protein n=1 Tax=Fusarium beomiforme TaxID=44412 RepID=A0A9P5AIR7_9HYPO|nr:hypothetical protein FBEOM_6534 [Fusarium beomiforme]